MFKDIVRALDYSDCAEVALVLFLASFAVILLSVFGLRHQSAHKFASIPLKDEIQDPRHA